MCLGNTEITPKYFITVLRYYNVICYIIIFVLKPIMQ